MCIWAPGKRAARSARVAPSSKIPGNRCYWMRMIFATERRLGRCLPHQQRLSAVVEGEPITNLANGEDVAWLGGVVFELPTKLTDVGVERATENALMIAPDFAQQFRPRRQASLSPKKGAEEVVLLGPERNRLVVPDHLSRRGFDSHGAERRSGRLRITRAGASQQRGDAGEQFPKRERLGDIVV